MEVRKEDQRDQDEKVVEIEIERLRDFKNHPFKVQADSQMKELQESIKKYGILNPLIVRPRPEGFYEIISGHRRKYAAQQLKYTKVEVSLVNAMSRELILRSMVDRLREFYDYIIIDCIPSLGMMTINALACADSVLIPVQAAYLPVKGLAVFVLAVSCMILKLWDIIEYAIGVICGHLFEILSM